MTTVVNAKGVPLPYTGASTHWFSATGAGPELHGTSGNDSFWGDTSVNVTMYGGAGSDYYHLYSTINRAVELPGEGIDTIDTWMSYKLPDNFENLVVTGNNHYAFGNSLDNIIKGGTSSQTFDGGLGNDVLIGGGGADTFIITKDHGSDLITDFGADDTIRLNGYDFMSFDDVKAHMIQAGSNLLLNLGSDEVLVFNNTTADKMQASQFELPIDKSGMTLSFSDDFNTLSLHNSQGGTWDTNFWWGAPNGSTLTQNNELQWYIDANYAPTSSIHPFSVDSNGVLTITAAQAPADIKPLINNYEYTSGLLTTHDTFSQTYGYFEMKADLPENAGAWPAFWLLPEDGTWPPELDVVEMYGQNPNQLLMTAHTNETGTHTKVGSTVNVSDTDGFHTYGLLWTPDKLVWTYDGVQVAEAATPSDMHSPMYMLVDLAVGGQAGAPPDHLATPAQMKIDYIHAYTLDDLQQSNLNVTGEHTV